MDCWQSCCPYKRKLPTTLRRKNSWPLRSRQQARRHAGPTYSATFCAASRKIRRLTQDSARRSLRGGTIAPHSVNFENALRLRPEDKASRERLDLSNQVLALDPSQRGLTREEQYQRSLKILELAVASATSCLASPLSADRAELVDSANKRLQRRNHPLSDGEAMEENMQLADKIWQIRKSECKGTPSSAIDLVLGKATQ